MSTVNETVANYIAAWNETDAGRRRDVIARAWNDKGSYVDAHRDSTGHAAIDAMIATVQERFPGYASGSQAASKRITHLFASVGRPAAQNRRHCSSAARIL